MSQIDPFTSLVPLPPRGQSLQAERVKKAQSQARNGDSDEDHQVETADVIVEIHDQQQQHPQKEKQHPQKEHAEEKPDSEAKPRLDVTA